MVFASLSKKLIKFQQEYISRNIVKAKRADFVARITKKENNDIIEFTNCGEAKARNVSIIADKNNKLFYYFYYYEYNKKFPLNELISNNSFHIPANITTSTSCNDKKCIIMWDDDFSEKNKKELNLNL